MGSTPWSSIRWPTATGSMAIRAAWDSVRLIALTYGFSRAALSSSGARSSPLGGVNSLVTTKSEDCRAFESALMLSSITQGGSVSGQCNSWEGIIKYQLSGSTAFFSQGVQTPMQHCPADSRRAQKSPIPMTVPVSGCRLALALCRDSLRVFLLLILWVSDQ